MRHLNEIVRERNQYSRDALEAWQDFINLKGRMDTELSKVTKRNNFLVEELETWKQQVCVVRNPAMCDTRLANLRVLKFLKFQSFAEQLTKETSELKVKIEGHKRENRRLTNLIDQQKDDAARLTLRLSGTEKQRDDALEALVLQQEIAEELERERKRNQKDLSALQHTTSTLTRQRDEAQRVVLHLRSLINGQAHHMEHIVRSVGDTAELSDYIQRGYAGLPEEPEEEDRTDTASLKPPRSLKSSSNVGGSSRASSADGKSVDGDDVTSEMEHHFLNSGKLSKRISQLSMSDVADRHLRDKTDAIADIIRSIGEQCAAAVEGLQLAQDAEFEEALEANKQEHENDNSVEDRQANSTRAEGSEAGDGEGNYLSPDGRASSIPPTPDLIHNRSSTSMSMASNSTVPERSSQQYAPSDLPTKILEDDDEHAHETDAATSQPEPGNLSKRPSRNLSGTNTTRVVT